MNNQSKSHSGTGVALLVGAIILAVVVYAMRPPSGFGEAMLRASQNPNAMVLTPTAYYGGLIVSALMALFGVLKLVNNKSD